MSERISTKPTAISTRPHVAIDAVVTHHLDGFRSGVARFNEMLAAALDVPLLGLFDEGIHATVRPLLSFKVSELGEPELVAVAGLFERSDFGCAVFLHELSGSPAESELIARADRVYAGNHEIAARLQGTGLDVGVAWAPGLIVAHRMFTSTDIGVFSFGMAHKLRVDMFHRLRTLLDGTGQSYSVYVSTANHETSSLRDSATIFEEMHEIFPDELFFLGNLSDVAVFNYLREATFFAAFFPGGVRANNTSVASAMECGAVVVTNLDEHSPPELVHMENIIDIDRCEMLPTDPRVLEAIGARARETAVTRSWDRLVEVLHS